MTGLRIFTVINLIVSHANQPWIRCEIIPVKLWTMGCSYGPFPMQMEVYSWDKHLQISINGLAGCWFQPLLKNISQWMSMGRIIPYIVENTCLKPPTSGGLKGIW